MNAKVRYDVVVIGGGPAGALSALLAAREGFTTLVLERTAFPRDKVCGGTLSGLAIEALENAGVSSVLSESRALPLREFECFLGGRSRRVPLSRHRVVARREFDAALLDHASRAGASVWFETHGDVVDNSAHRAIVSARGAKRDLTIEAGAVVIATGLGGRALGDCEIEPRSRIGAGAVLRVESDTPPHVLRMAIGKQGYVGWVRLPDGRIDVAAALDVDLFRRHSLGAACDTILDQAGVTSLRLGDRPLRGTPELTRTPMRVAHHRVFSVGDAAGYAEPFTGEGIGWALSSALVLAPLFRRIVRGDPLTAREFESRMGVVVRDRQRLCRSLATLLRHPLAVEFAFTALRVAPFLGRKVVERLDRGPNLLETVR